MSTLSTASKFASDRRGNFAMMSAFLTVPLVLGVGLSVDLTNLARTKSELQSALDSAVLAIAREGKDVTDAKAKDIAWQFLGGNFDLDVTKLSIQRDGTEIKLAADTTTDLAFGKMAGLDDWPIEASASADIAYATYEIGLILDTTGSMAGGKLQAMKDAVEGLIDSMSAQVNDKDKLKFALVPFASFVNVGPGYGPTFDKTGKQVAGTGALWLDLAGNSPIAQKELVPGLSRFQLFNHLNRAWPGCVETRAKVGSVDYGTSDITPDPTKPETLFVPTFAIDEQDTGGYSNSYIPSLASTLDGSILGTALKMLKYGVPVNALGIPIPFGTTTTLNPVGLTKWTKVSLSGGSSKGPDQLCVTQAIDPLSNDYKDLKKKVNQLKANGNTNIMEGVAWGMRVLSPGAPFTQGADEKTGVEKMMIVLTDGANTFGNNKTGLGSTYNSYGYLVDGRVGVTSGTTTKTNELMNEKTLAACDAAKAAGVEVYTIRLEEPDVATGSMLKDCASDADHYYDVPSREQLDEVFSTIRDRIVRVRISS